jgi:glycolate oxidase
LLTLSSNAISFHYSLSKPITINEFIVPNSNETEHFFAKLAAIYPLERLLTSVGSLAAFKSDGLTAFEVRPRAIVMPESEFEIVETIRLCQNMDVPFVARGSGTSLSGGSLPHQDGIVIALNRLNKILHLDPDRRIAIVQPGVINMDITRAAERYGLFYAPDPSSQQVCTIGGNLAFNSGGAHCLKYGMTTNHVLGARVVMADGQLAVLGGESLEIDGPDWLGLFCGSEGLLGIAIEITVRLLTKPEAFYTVLAGYDSIELAGEAVGLIIASGLLPAAMEIMDRMSMKAATAAVGATYPPDVEAVLIVELDGSREAVEAEREELAALIRASKASATLVAQDADQRAMMWKGRKSVFSAVGRLSPDFIVQDGVVPRSKLGFALREIDRICREHEVPVANVFHAGDGNLHPLILYDGRKPGALHRAEAAAAQILRLCIELGGSITGEHGVGMEKREFLPEMFDASSIDVMRRIRKSIDPREVANRGKMFPGGENHSTTLHGLHPLEKAGIAERM